MEITPRSVAESASGDELETRWEWLDSFWQSTTLRVGVAVLAVVLLAADLLFLVRTITGDPYWLITTDAGLYFNTAKLIRAGQNPYVFAINEGYRFYGAPAYDRFVYPPLLADLLIPLLWLGDLGGRLAWTLFVGGCLVATVALLLRGFGRPLPWVWIAFLLGLWGLSRMVRFDLYHAQVNYPLLLVLVLGAWLYSRGSTIGTGLLWGILPVVKPFFGVLTLYLLWRRDWPTAVISILTSAILLVFSFVPVLASDPLGLIGWVEASLAVSAPTFSARPDHLSLHSLILRLFVENPFTIPVLNSPWLARGLQGLTLVGLVALFFVALPRRDGLGAMVRRLPEADEALDDEGEETARPAVERPAPAVLLAELGLVLALIMTYGPATSGSHLQMLLPGIVGVCLLAYEAVVRRQADRRLWLLIAAVWLLLLILRASPLPLTASWLGTAFGNPNEATWAPTRALATLLITGQGTLHLLLAIGLLVVGLRRRAMPAWQRQPEESRGHHSPSAQPI